MKSEKPTLDSDKIAILAGAIWIFGSIDIEHSKTRGYFQPRIMITMPMPLPYHYREFAGGNVWVEKDGMFTLDIGRQREVWKLLNDLKQYLGGEERIQVESALEIMELNRSRRLPKEEKNQKRTEAFNRFKESRAWLEKWNDKFLEDNDKAIREGLKKKRKIPRAIWNRAYNWPELMKRYQ